MGRRVLIIDDNTAFRAAARQLLERGGFVVVAEAADGVDGLQAAKEHTPDLAIVDVQLPDFDGFEVAERLAETATPPEVILTSSRDGVDYGSCVQDCGARGFVPKAELSGAALAALLPA